MRGDIVLWFYYSFLTVGELELMSSIGITSHKERRIYAARRGGVERRMGGEKGGRVCEGFFSALQFLLKLAPTPQLMLGLKLRCASSQRNLSKLALKAEALPVWNKKITFHWKYWMAKTLTRALPLP